jgi:hypothetical protein
MSQITALSNVPRPVVPLQHRQQARGERGLNLGTAECVGDSLCQGLEAKDPPD